MEEVQFRCKQNLNMLLTHMQNIKGCLFSTHYHPSALQQTPHHSQEASGELCIVHSAERPPAVTPQLGLANPTLIVGDLYQNRHRG